MSRQAGASWSSAGGGKTISNGKHASVRRRHEQILEQLQVGGFVAVGDLAERFSVTPQTMRRDINTLAGQGLVQRFHGGVGPALSTENVAYTDRQILCREEKRRIARDMARCIPPKSSLFINIGTTTEEVARALRGHERLRVITNNLNVATILTGHANIELIVAGGVVRHRDGGIVGEAAADFIRQFKVDFGIIGISGIDADGTLLDYDYREVRAARAIIDNSRKVFLATDYTKFGRNAMVRLGHLSEIDALFTDRNPPAVLEEVMRESEVALHVAGG
nr:DeoR family transcriptional regulator [Desulfovibrio ferrophilus]